MPLSRRSLLRSSAIIAASAAVPTSSLSMGTIAGRDLDDWDDVRNLFPLARDRIDMSTMLITAHPKPVADAIAGYRAAMDERPVEFLEENDDRLTQAVRDAAGAYLGIEPSHIALTDSTTMGIGLVYAGFPFQEGDEVLTTKEDYVVTHETLRLAAARTGASVRIIDLYDEAATATSDEIVSTIIKSITPATKLIALTWVHSSTGMKMPIPQISKALRDVNAKRDESDQILLGLDAVHGFGIENVSFGTLGCDFFMAGCHKWLFGPRGTGIIAVSERGLAKLRPVMHSFDDSEVVSAWITGKEEPEGRNNGLRLTPGGFKPFEHRWAMTEAFDLHARIGRDRVDSRTHQLASMLKETLNGTSGITLATPLATELSSGIVSFKVKGDAPRLTAGRLRERGIIASVAPYATPWVRLTPSVRNSEDEIEQVRAAIAEVA